MQFSKLNKDGAENVYRTVLNVEGATMTTGLPASLANTSTDGVSAVIANASADYPGFIGWAVQDIPNNSYGRIQTSGFVLSILLSNVNTSVTINALDPLFPAPGGSYSGAPTYANSGFKFAMASNTPAVLSTGASLYVSGMIKMV